ncbi:MAG: internal scaffolding protein [Arizlama microvirus]|nr:MAG: internal scaffolding protein [Arizlama microvirus]
MTEPNFRTAYEHRKCDISSFEPSLTKQSFKDECDINNILKKYIASGSLEHRKNIEDGSYFDVSDVGDYQEALNKVIETNNLFASLPSRVRFQFGNDPSKFLEYVNNPANEQELTETGILGLLPKNRPDVPSDPVDSTTSPEEAFPTPSRKATKTSNTKTGETA